jgi:anaerobic ribonucleoside-triphosphate reductase
MQKKVINKKRMEVQKKVPVECYSRVVGYFRPVEQWNRGKIEEFYHRKNLIFF